MSRAVTVLALLAVIASLPTPASAQESIPATASRVIDGDTIEATLPGGTTDRVRLIGIDTPESVAPGQPVECGAEDAAQTLRDLIEGKPIRLTSDPTQDQRDRFNRRLAYVDTDQFDAGREMIRRGWSDVYVFANRPFQRQPPYEQTRDEARTALRGVWAACEGNFHGEAQEEAVAEDEEERPDRAAAAALFVRRYYHRVSERRFRQAWVMLSFNLRARLGSYSSWRSGFGRSIGTRVNRSTATWNGTRAVVSVAIRSRDRDACNGRTVSQFFRGRWTLVRRDSQWRATRIAMKKVGGGRVRVAKSQCPKPKRRRARNPSDGGEGGGGGGSGCHPSYRPCVPNDRDYDCGELPGSDYQVVGPDEYRLDGDNDGVGCES